MMVNECSQKVSVLFVHSSLQQFVGDRLSESCCVVIQYDVGGVMQFITLLPDQDVVVSVDGGENGNEQEVSDLFSVFASL
jgi:hypothetical protein